MGGVGIPGGGVSVLRRVSLDVHLRRELGMHDEEQDAQVDRTHFVLSDERWRAFTEILERPARSIPKLERLLKQPSILERNLQENNESENLQ